MILNKEPKYNTTSIAQQRKPNNVSEIAKLYITEHEIGRTKKFQCQRHSRVHYRDSLGYSQVLFMTASLLTHSL